MASIPTSESKSDKFKDHRVAHLFLLIGTNPLPNYVAARLLAGTDCRFYLMASKGTAGTEGVAERLKTCLKADGFDKNRFTIFSVENPSDRHSIRDAIEKLDLFNPPSPFFIKPDERVGLHYTGGTKPMAVHAYEYLKEECKGKNRGFHYSYLDPRKLAFRFEGDFVEIKPNDCRLPLDKLLALHGWEKGESSSNFASEALARRVGSAISSESSLDAFRNPFLNRNKETPLAELVPPPLLKVNSMKELVHTLELREEDKSYKNLNAYLTGGFWLEDYVAACIQDIASDCDVDFAGTNISPHRQGTIIKKNLSSDEGKKDKEGKMFEFDVAAMRGYQLFAFSCGISPDRKELKKKLFEVYTRARQIGGEEARVALVCGTDSTPGLLKEINEEWLEGRGVIKVFGPKDYSDLRRQLKIWFTQT